MAYSLVLKCTNAYLKFVVVVGIAIIFYAKHMYVVMWTVIDHKISFCIARIGWQLKCAADYGIWHIATQWPVPFRLHFLRHKCTHFNLLSELYSFNWKLWSGIKTFNAHSIQHQWTWNFASKLHQLSNVPCFGSFILQEWVCTGKMTLISHLLKRVNWYDWLSTFSMSLIKLLVLFDTIDSIQKSITYIYVCVFFSVSYFSFSRFDRWTSISIYFSVHFNKFKCLYISRCTLMFLYLFFSPFVLFVFGAGYHPFASEIETLRRNTRRIYDKKEKKNNKKGDKFK